MSTRKGPGGQPGSSEIARRPGEEPSRAGGGKPAVRRPAVPQPGRIRRIEGSFAWIDHRLLRHGFLQVMTDSERSLYLFFCLAADRDGVSFHRLETVCDVLGLEFPAFHVARDRLVELGLIAFAPYSVLSPNGFHQVLPVDGRPPDFAAQVAERLARGG